MRRILTVLMCLLLTACGGGSEKTEVIVFAAASLQEAFTEIGEAYTAAHEEIELVFNFDSSGTLQMQIAEGAACGIFVSAGQKQMDALSALQLVREETRMDLLENKAALAVPEGNPAGIGSYADLRERLEAGTVLLAMGGGGVPVGQYTQEIFAYFGLREEDLAAAGCLTYGSNVKEVTAQVAEGTVDCGIIYATDAKAAGLTVVDVATEEMCGQVIYPAALLAGSGEAEEAFYAYLCSAEAAEVLTACGFTPLV